MYTRALLQNMRNKNQRLTLSVAVIILLVSLFDDFSDVSTFAESENKKINNDNNKKKKMWARSER